MDSFADLVGSAPDPGYPADTGHLLQSKCNFWWTATVPANDVRQEISSDVSLFRDFFLGGFLFGSLHGQLNKVVDDKLSMKKREFFTTTCCFYSNK